MFWSPLVFQFFANFILNLDASMVGWLLGTARTGTIIRFADGSGSLIILPACSSMANISIALLAWVAINQLVGHQWSIRSILSYFMACASVIVINVTRMAIMGLSFAHYASLHSPWGDMAVNIAIIATTVGFCLWGVKGEKFTFA